MDPAERLTCEQLLQQPYFDSLRHKSESSSREQQERNKRSRFPRRHLPAGVKSSPAEHSPSHVREEGQTCIVLHFFNRYNILRFFPFLQYLPQLTGSTVFPAVDNKRYYNLRKFNYHLPNI